MAFIDHNVDQRILYAIDLYFLFSHLKRRILFGRQNNSC